MGGEANQDRTPVDSDEEAEIKRKAKSTLVLLEEPGELRKRSVRRVVSPDKDRRTQAYIRRKRDV